MGFPTPCTSHITTDASFRGQVYEPSEDTFVFLDALEQDVGALTDLRPSVVVDIGCGSGCIGTFLVQLLQKGCEALYTDATTKEQRKLSCGLPVLLSIDINPVACIATKVTSRVNNVSAHHDCVAASLCSVIREGIADVVTFNPPYVATESSEVNVRRGDITAAWAGGHAGAEVIHQFIDQLPRILSNNGYVYLLAEKTNDIPDLQRRLASRGFTSVILLEKRRRNEKLSILRCCRKKREASTS